MIRNDLFNKDWAIKPLHEVVTFLDNLRKPIKASERVEGEIPYYGANGIQSYVNDYIFNEPLILLAEDGGHFGNPNKTIAYIIRGKSWVNNHAHVLKVKEGVDINFLCRQLEKYDVRNFVSGSTRPKLTKSDAMNIPIAVPDLPTQSKIVQTLNKSEFILQKRKESLKLLDEFLKSTFLDMFGDPGLNQKSWEITSIRELTESIDKINLKNFPDSNVEYVDISSINGRTKVITNTKKYIGIDAPSRARQILRQNDILVSTVRPNLNSVAIVNIIDEGKIDKIIGSTGFCVLRAKNNIADFHYLFHLVQSTYFIDELTKNVRGANYPAVSNKTVLDLKIPLPPIELQNKFADIVQQTELLKSQYQESEKELNNLFNSLMQRAFKGEL